PSAQLVGVARPELCEPMASVLQQLGVRRAMVVCGNVAMETHANHQPGPLPSKLYLDEISTVGETVIAEFYQPHGFTTSRLAPNSFPISSCTLADLAGGHSSANAATVEQLLL